MVDINSLIEQIQALGSTHPYLALGIVLLVIAYFVNQTLVKLFIIALAGFAILKDLNMLSTFVDLLKDFFSTALGTIKSDNTAFILNSKTLLPLLP